MTKKGQNKLFLFAVVLFVLVRSSEIMNFLFQKGEVRNFLLSVQF